MKICLCFMDSINYLGMNRKYTWDYPGKNSERASYLIWTPLSFTGNQQVFMKFMRINSASLK